MIPFIQTFSLFQMMYYYTSPPYFLPISFFTVFPLSFFLFQNEQKEKWISIYLSILNEYQLFHVYTTEKENLSLPTLFFTLFSVLLPWIYIKEEDHKQHSDDSLT